MKKFQLNKKWGWWVKPYFEFFSEQHIEVSASESIKCNEIINYLLIDVVKFIFT